MVGDGVLQRVLYQLLDDLVFRLFRETLFDDRARRPSRTESGHRHVARVCVIGFFKRRFDFFGRDFDSEVLPAWGEISDGDLQLQWYLPFFTSLHDATWGSQAGG